MKARLSARCFTHSQVFYAPCVKSCQTDTPAITIVMIIISVSTMNPPIFLSLRLPARTSGLKAVVLGSARCSGISRRPRTVTPQRAAFQQPPTRKLTGSYCLPVRISVARQVFFLESAERSSFRYNPNKISNK